MMTLTISGSTNGAGAPIGTCADTTGRMISVETNLPSLRVYNLGSSSITQILSSTTLAAPLGVTMIDTACAVVHSSSVSTVDFIDIVAGNRSNVAGGAAGNSSFANNQTIAGDPTLKIAIAVTSTSNQLVRINGNNFTVTTFLLQGLTNEVPRCVVLKNTNRWLVGCSFGTIFEIDNFGNIIDSWRYTVDQGFTSTSTLDLTIQQLCIETGNNMLLVNTYQGAFLMDWSSKTVLSGPLHTMQNSAWNTTIICGGASSISVIGSKSYSNQGSFQVLDFSTPYFSATQAMLDTTASLVTTGINASGYCWVTDNNQRIRCAKVTPNNTILRTVSTTINGINYPARVFWINDSNGADNSQIVSDTYMNSPGTYRLPGGMTLYECVQINDGSTAYFDVTKFNS